MKVTSPWAKQEGLLANNPTSADRVIFFFISYFGFGSDRLPADNGANNGKISNSGEGACATGKSRPWAGELRPLRTENRKIEIWSSTARSNSNRECLYSVSQGGRQAVAWGGGGGGSLRLALDHQRGELAALDEVVQVAADGAAVHFVVGGE